MKTLLSATLLAFALTGCMSQKSDVNVSNNNTNTNTSNSNATNNNDAGDHSLF